MSAIEEARQKLTEAIEGIDQERESLNAALKSLGGSAPARRPGRPAGASTAAPKARKKAKRAKHGQRQDEFLSAVRAKSGITVAEAAKKMGVAPQPIYALARKLTKEKRIAKAGKAGYKETPATKAAKESTAA